MGYPVRPCMSPIIARICRLQALNIHAASVPYSVKPEDLGKATMALRALNVSGVNVTVPHKNGVIEFLDELDASAKQVGAVNTIRAEKRKAAWLQHRRLRIFVIAAQRDGRTRPGEPKKWWCWAPAARQA